MTDKIRIENALRALFVTFAAEASEDLLRGYFIGLSSMTAEQIEIIRQWINEGALNN